MSKAPLGNAQPALRALLALCLGGFACQGSDSTLGLSAGSPRASCSANNQCADGLCTCGVCTTSCGDGGSCPSGTECFAEGSTAHALSCGSESVSGVCLAACAIDAQCLDDQLCLNGACVRRDALSEPPTAVGRAAAGPQALQSLADQVWLPENLSYEMVDDRQVAALEGCLDDPPCATLKEALHEDSCASVHTGCGLVQVAHGSDLYATRLWYEAFSQLPVGSFREWQVATQPLECGNVDSSCSACGIGGASCEQAPIAWPEPPPRREPPSSCQCTPETETRSRVSLQCFCDVYGCPQFEELRDACLDPSSERRADPYGGLPSVPFQVCGLIWFVEGSYAGKRYGYDSSGRLVAAAAFTPAGPVSEPCDSFVVLAGEPTDCDLGALSFLQSFDEYPLELDPTRVLPDVESCNCSERFYAQPPRSCEVSGWFPATPMP